MEFGGVYAVGDQGAGVSVFVAVVVLRVGADQGVCAEVFVLGVFGLDHPVAVLGDEDVGGTAGFFSASAEEHIGVGVAAGHGDVVVAWVVIEEEAWGVGQFFPHVMVADIGEFGEFFEEFPGEAF